MQTDKKEITNIIDYLITLELNKINNKILYRDFLKKVCLVSNIIENLYMILHFFQFKSLNLRLNIKNNINTNCNNIYTDYKK